MWFIYLSSFRLESLFLPLTYKYVTRTTGADSIGDKDRGPCAIIYTFLAGYPPYRVLTGQ